MQLTINGEIRQMNEALTVQALIEKLALKTNQVAIERNRAIVPRSAYGNTLLTEGDAIEIVQFIGGG